MAVFDVSLAEQTNLFTADFENQSEDFTTEFDTVVEVTPNAYTGAYEFVPTAETQVISIADKKAIQDIIIEPIPSNYGLITWNGSYLIVS